MDGDVKISVIIPTWNRSFYLKKAINSFLEQTFSQKFYEIIVVDNNCTDDTKQIVQDMSINKEVNVKYFFQKAQGLHHATNLGICKSKGEIIVFGDDDIIVEKNFLEKIYNTFQNDKTIGIVGGKIIPIWDETPPQWIYDYGSNKIHSVFAYLDYGNNYKILDKEYVFGCNFSIKKEVAINIGGRPPDTFPKHLKHLSGGGEAMMVNYVRNLGLTVIYQPEAVVYHHASVKRATIEYFIDRYERFSVEQVYHHFRFLKKEEAIKNILLLIVIKIKNILNYKYSKFFKIKNNVYANKINPDYFALVEKYQALMLIKQMSRVLIDKSLYETIKKVSYLDE